MHHNQSVKGIILGAAVAAAIGMAVLPAHEVWGAINTPLRQSVQTVSATTGKVLPAGIKIAAKPIHTSTDTYTANIQIPVISGMKDKAYEKQWNNAINQRIVTDLEQIRKQAASDKAEVASDGTTFHPYRIEVNYTAMNTDGIISLRVETYTLYSGMRGNREVTTYNVRNNTPASAVTLKSLFGSNYQKTISTNIAKQIKHSKESYFNGSFKKIAADQPFYLKDGNVHIVFQAETIAADVAGIIEFTIPVPR